MYTTHSNQEMTYTEGTTALPKMWSPPLSESDLFAPPIYPDQATNMGARAALFAAPQATAFDPFVNAQFIPRPEHRLQPMATDITSIEMAQKHYYQQQRGQDVRQQPQMYQDRQRNTVMGRQHLQNRNPAQRLQHQQYRQQYQPVPQPNFVPTQRQQHYGLRRNYATPPPTFTPVESPNHLYRSGASSSSELVTKTPTNFSKSGYISTTQQFSQPQHQPNRPTTSRLTTAASILPSPGGAPVNTSYTTQIKYPFTPSPSPQYESARSGSTNLVHQNEATEYERLEQERTSQRERYEKRRDELRKDTNAIYHSYNEVLEYFPLRRSERPSPYLACLIANQTAPTEPNSDRGLAISFAKRHWQSFWEMQDMDYVVERAKVEQAERRQKLAQS